MKQKLGFLGLCLGLTLFTAAPAQADLLPPDRPVVGHSQAELSANWWQWALSHPAGANPILDDGSGNLAALGDQGAIFFLAGSASTAPVTRSVTIDSNQRLFFPLINAVNVKTLPEETEALLRQQIAAGLDGASGLFAHLDDVSLALAHSTTSLLDYRQLSPDGFFDLELPDGNLFGLPVGTYEGVSDGYWLALGQLAPGAHELHFGGQTSGFSQDITYNITVRDVPEPSLLLLGATGLALLLCFRPRRPLPAR